MCLACCFAAAALAAKRLVFNVYFQLLLDGKALIWFFLYLFSVSCDWIVVLRIRVASCNDTLYVRMYYSLVLLHVTFYGSSLTIYRHDLVEKYENEPDNPLVHSSNLQRLYCKFIYGARGSDRGGTVIVWVASLLVKVFARGIHSKCRLKADK